ncbi:MAG: hypothetical protein JXB04_05180 [Kiritimatiellae bacterium]|nr:hypothetical protein [Kiritimatiellia bacterium]
MNKPTLDVNRPVHLARRDCFFERAVELLYMPMQEMDTAARLARVERVLALLKTAENHADFAVRSARATDKERDFLHFLKLILQSVLSAHAMMLHQAHLEAEESFLCQFLNTRPEDSALPAMAYQRRSEDILQGLWHVLRLAHSPYRALQDETLNAMSDADRERYRKAGDSFKRELDEAHNAPNTNHPFSPPQ